MTFELYSTSKNSKYSISDKESEKEYGERTDQLGKNEQVLLAFSLC